MTMGKIQAFPPSFPVKKFSVNGEFLQVFGSITQKFAEAVLL